MNTMQELVPVNYENEERPTVLGRDLHKALEVKTQYKDWFPRMCEYGFVEGTDFNPLKNEQVQMEGSRAVARMVTDHQISIDMAKEICMIQRSEIGKRCHKYFLELERRWNSPEEVFACALRMANQRLEEFKEQNAILLDRVTAQEQGMVCAALPEPGYAIAQ